MMSRPLSVEVRRGLKHHHYEEISQPGQYKLSQVLAHQSPHTICFVYMRKYLLCPRNKNINVFLLPKVKEN